MKKLSLILVCAIFAICAYACSSQKNAAAPINATSKSDLTGTWLVVDIKLEGFPTDYQIGNAFNIAPYQSFIGSTWRLYSSYKGQISLSNGTSENIYWDLVSNGGKPMFQFKTVPSGSNARDIREGYRLDINRSDVNHLILRSPFSIENDNIAANIAYYLEKQ